MSISNQPALETLDTRRPFTRADAVAAGITPKLLRGSRFRRIFRGVYVARDVTLTPDLRALAALAVHPPGAFVSHFSAARLLGVPVPATTEEHVSVAARPDRRRRPGLRNHVASQGVQVTKVRGIRCSTALDTFTGLASVLSLVDLVVAGDAMVALGLTTPRALLEHAEACTGHGAVRARRAAALVRAGVDSPMETRLRLLIVLAGLPEPVVNHIVRDDHGNWVMRFDLSYPWLRLIIEYDGRQHADNAKQWRRDLARREQLDISGWRLMVVTAEGIYREPYETLRRIEAALRERGCTTLPGALDDRWRHHFLVS